MEPYVESLLERFGEHSNPENAAAMKKYMKGKFDYFGIKSPLRKELSRTHIREQGIPKEEDVETIMHACWAVPQREVQYFAMELAGRVAKKAELCRVDLYEYMALEKSWWDTIDYIASNLVGVHFQKFPDAIVPYTGRWMDSGNIWLQRISLLFQLKYRDKTDLDLMSTYIHRLTGSKEFFINKAIGWILREYSKTNASWVIRYVEDHAAELAPLSRREALKWLQNNNRIPNM